MGVLFCGCGNAMCRENPRRAAEIETQTPDVEFVCTDELVVYKVLLRELFGLLIYRHRMD